MSAHFRIREAARQAGISPALLRAWERRYGVIAPARSDGGYRLYSSEDVERVTRMNALVANGVPPAEAAKTLLAETGNTDVLSVGLARRRAALLAAIGAFDEFELQRLLDETFAALAPEVVLREVIYPLLAEVGEAWEQDHLSIAHEHFATAVLRARLLGLTRGWSRGVGPLALLACPAGEEHDLGLLGFGIALNRLGWRIGFLGANTPLDEIARAAAALNPDAIGIAVTRNRVRIDPVALASLARTHRILLGGAGAQRASLRELPAERLSGDPVTAAEQASTRRPASPDSIS